MESSYEVSSHIMEMAEKMIELSEMAVFQYRPIVECILCEEITDVMEIERIMDGMLDFCQFDNMLSLFKELCRGLYSKYPVLVHDYILYYREMWDTEM